MPLVIGRCIFHTMISFNKLWCCSLAEVDTAAKIRFIAPSLHPALCIDLKGIQSAKQVISDLPTLPVFADHRQGAPEIQTHPIYRETRHKHVQVKHQVWT